MRRYWMGWASSHRGGLSNKSLTPSSVQNLAYFILPLCLCLLKVTPKAEYQFILPGVYAREGNRSREGNGKNLSWTSQRQCSQFTNKNQALNWLRQKHSVGNWVYCLYLCRQIVVILHLINYTLSSSCIPQCSQWSVVFY